MTPRLLYPSGCHPTPIPLMPSCQCLAQCSAAHTLLQETLEVALVAQVVPLCTWSSGTPPPPPPLRLSLGWVACLWRGSWVVSVGVYDCDWVCVHVCVSGASPLKRVTQTTTRECLVHPARIAGMCTHTAGHPWSLTHPLPDPYTLAPSPPPYDRLCVLRGYRHISCVLDFVPPAAPQR